MEITRLSEKVSFIPGPANVGILQLGNSEIALVDSGIDEAYAERILALLSDYRFKISYILNTHAHADHIGGNSLIQERTGCRILASTLEAPMIRQPLIQSAVLFSGAPIIELTNRFIMGKPSNVEILEGSEFKAGNLEIKILDLPGHSVNQKGFQVENIAFIADTLFPETFFRKQRLPFNYDPGAHINTLEKLKTIKARQYIGGHFHPTESIESMINLNLHHLNSALDFMRSLLKIPHPQDRIVKAFLDHFGLKKNNWEYYLYRATVNGYLSTLHRHGEANFRILDNLPVWYATE